MKKGCFLLMFTLILIPLVYANCGVLNSNTTLSGDVNSTGTCFNINASGIILDCNGYSINYSSSVFGHAINNTGFDNLTIKNCNIFVGNSAAHRKHSIFSKNAQNMIIDNNNITTIGEWIAGIYLNESSSRITNNTIITSGHGGYGIHLLNSSNSHTITENRIITKHSSIAQGIHLYKSSNSILTSNNINTSGNGEGIVINSSSNLNLTDNIIKTNYNYAKGIFLLGNSNLNTMLNNNITAKKYYEIQDDTGDSYINYLVYNNSYGEIRWTNESFLKNLTLNGSIGLDNNLYIVENNITLNISAFDSTQINSSAILNFYNVDNFSNALPLINGQRCTGCSDLVGSGNYSFNVTHFTSYSVGQDCGSLNSDMILAMDVSSNGYCFHINASNIILDCNGHSINYSSSVIGHAINNTGFDNITIKNCNIFEGNSIIGLQHSIYSKNAQDMIIDNNNITTIGSWVSGIFLDQSSSRITNNTIITLGNAGAYGIHLFNSSNSHTVTENRIITKDYKGQGIHLYKSSNSILTSNNINTSGNGEGIVINSSSNLNLTDNIIKTNYAGAEGIFLLGDSNLNTMLNNNITAKKYYEINDETGDSYINYLVYNNSYGEIRWTDETNGSFLKNLTLNGSIGLDNNLYIGDNALALNTSAFTEGDINSSAKLTLKNLSFETINDIRRLDTYSTNSSEIVSNGANCNGTSCLISSQNSSLGELIFNTSYFSSFSALLDQDGDGIYDNDDTLKGTTNDVTTSGINNLNITVGGNTTNGTFSGEQEVIFYDGSTTLINFTHNFSQSSIDLQKIKIDVTSTSIVVNLSGQLIGDETKTLFLTDNNFISLCIKDAEIASISAISSGCNGTNETDFTNCLGNSTGIFNNSLACYDEGTRIRIENLTHSAIRGAQEPESPQPPGGGSGGGSPSTQTTTPPCQEQWTCTLWGECNPSGLRRRTCTDSNSCGSITSKPYETASCTYIPPAELEELPVAGIMEEPTMKMPFGEKIKKILFDLIWLWVIVALVGIGILVFIFLKRRNQTKTNFL